MKKLAAMLVLLIAALVLVACGGGSNSSTSEGTSPAAGAAEEAEEKAEEAGEEAEEKGEELEKEAEGAAGGASVEIEANPEGNLEFTTKSASAKAGKVTVDFTNESPVPHDVAIESESGETLGKTEIISEGSDSTTVNLKPGTYHFYCTVPGHRDAGMEGTLTVK
jgi:plastocyanin